MQSILLFFFTAVVSVTGFSSNLIDDHENFDAVLQEGDLIFHQSTSPQSAAIGEATGSPWSHVGIIVNRNNFWYVVEARQGIEITALKNFIDRGRNKQYKIFRFPAFTNSVSKINLYQALAKYMKKPYDIYFEFSNDRIYCSELTYKVMLELTGQQIGTVNKMKELRLDGPYVKQLIKLRLTDLGKKLDPEEPIVTPISQMLDTKLSLILSMPL